jgi:membrane protein DedA with SNARE-associated domain
MQSIASFIQEYGTTYAYVIVFLGALIEGESIILSSSALAYMGHLNIYTIMLLAFMGTWFADQMLYILGRQKGEVIFQRFPKLKKPSEKAFHLLRKWDAGFIIACRFIYGIRTTSSIVVGAAGIPPHRFVPLNILSAVIWTIVSCGAGYLLGPVVISFFEHFNQIQKYLIFGVLLILVIVFVRKKTKK